MQQRLEAAHRAALQPKTPLRPTIPWFNPADLDLLALLHPLARKGVPVRLIVEPPPDSIWYLEILKDRSVLLRLPVDRDTPLACTDSSLF
jgi:hypothetical protein